VNLARQTSVRRELSFHSETVALEFLHFTGFALKDLNAARGATRVAAAAVKNVNSGVFNC
jgi:hypothetical protein